MGSTPDSGSGQPHCNRGNSNARAALSGIVGFRHWRGQFRCAGRYLLVVVGCSLAWESLHMPLYTLWETATVWEVVTDVVQCTGANMGIALASLVLAMAVVGSGSWPGGRYVIVGAVACGFGVVYTLFSEWLNVQVRHTWGYSDLMPVIPGLDVGLSPVAQWIVIPLVGLWCARRGVVPRQSGN